MSAVIRLDLLLRETITTPYHDLVTRPTGAAIRERVIRALEAAPGLDAELDFSAVRILDYSCADEVVAKLLAAEHLPVTRIVLRGVSDEHADAIEHALNCHGLAVVIVAADSTLPRLLGAVTDDGHAVFAALLSFGRTEAVPIANSLAWPAERALQALQDLARHRCVLAYPDATFELGAVA
ncbi:MAG: hypothetical protein ABIZ70_02455 [Gemmatimonadales bacterium]